MTVFRPIKMADIPKFEYFSNVAALKSENQTMKITCTWV